MSPKPKPFFLLPLWLLLTCLLPACKNPVPQPADHPATADSIIGRANVLLRNGENRHFIHYIDSAYLHFLPAGRGDRWKKYNEEANYYLNYEIDPVKARLYADSMQAVIDGQTAYYKEPYARTLFIDGDVLMAEHRYGEAFDCYYRGLQFARKHLDTCALSQFSNQLGLVKYRQGKYLEAVPYIKQALRESGYCDSSRSAYLSHSMLNTVALCFDRSGMPDSAVHYYHSALTLLQRQGLQHPGDSVYLDAARGVIYGNLGGLYSNLKDYMQAEHYLKQSISINNRPGYEMGDAITAELKLARLYLDMKKDRTADSVLGRTALDLDRQQARHQTDYSLRVQWYWLHWQYLDRAGKVPEAYTAAKRYYYLRDSIESATGGLQSADMGTAFKASQQEQRLALLARDNEVKKISLRATIGLAVMAAIIIWLIIISLRRSRRQVAELTRLNTQVFEQNNRLQQAFQELEQSQKEIEEKTHFLQGLLNNLPVILYQIDPDGIITTSTGAGLKVVPDWTNDQLVGIDAFSLAPDMADAFNKAMRGEHARAVNAFAVESGSFYFDTIVLPDSTRKGGIIGFAVDVTAAKKAEQEIIANHQQLKQLNAFKDKLLSVISHDLRQPFSSILMASEVLKLTNKHLSKEELEMIVLELRDTAAKSIGLLEGLLCWVQAERENFQYRPQPVNLHDTFAEANGIYAYSQQQKQVSLINQIPDGLTIMAHHQMLLFINRNLISNATKYSPRGGKIIVNAQNNGYEVIISVTDQGHGMNMVQLEKLFRVQDESTFDHLRGAGIALSICYDMIRQMNGRIWAVSEPDKGASFCYALPV